MPRCRPARALTVSGDDPDNTHPRRRPAQRGPQEAEQWRVTAGAQPRLVARHPEAFAHHAGPTSGSPWAETDREDSGSWNWIVRAAAPPPHRWIALPGPTEGSVRGCRHGAGAPGAPRSAGLIARLSCVRPSTAASW